MSKLSQWIRKNLKLVAGGILLPVALTLSGCATTSSTPAVTSPTSSTSTSVNYISSASKAAYVSYFEACSSYAIAMLGVKAAIVNGTIKPASFPTIKNVVSIVTPICQQMPVNLSGATVTILTEVAQLNAMIPTTTTGSNVPVTPINIPSLSTTAPTTSTGVK